VKIAQLREFGPTDSPRTIVHLLWLARETLGRAMRDTTIAMPVRASLCLDSAEMIRAAKLLAYNDLGHDTGAIWTHMDLADDSARSAKLLGLLAARYGELASEGKSTWEKERAEKANTIFRKAAESAQQCVHRALSQICDVLPEDESLLDADADA
jgi:hypothetical protein